MVSLYIATPCHRSLVDAQYAISLAVLADALKGVGVDYNIKIQDGSEVNSQRSYLASDFLTGGFSHLLFIDDDIIFQPPSVLALVAAQKAIIGCLYPKRDDSGECIAETEIIGPKPANGIVPIKSIGMGLTLIERAVFQRMVDKNAVRSITNKTWGFFDHFQDPGQHWGEDFSFCRRWRDIGGEIFALVGEKIGHAGRVVYW